MLVVALTDTLVVALIIGDGALEEVTLVVALIVSDRALEEVALHVRLVVGVMVTLALVVALIVCD